MRIHAPVVVEAGVASFVLTSVPLALIDRSAIEAALITALIVSVVAMVACAMALASEVDIT